jgi:GalNAc-alpha-(1->4)-GalNAc-alpha-(1->3)-diNAcBac-PP-undecaprenol alpha-1,4-N-acetyl-D-galactosaminyltransferase
MKIIIVLPSINIGGAERVASILEREWNKKNETKIVVFDVSNSTYSFKGEIIDLKLRSFNTIIFKVIQLIRRSFQLLKIFRKEKPDQIFSFMESANFPSIISSCITGNLNKLTISVHADPVTMPKTHRLLISFLYLYPRKIVSVSKGVYEALSKIGISKKKLKLIYNPLSDTSPNISSPLAKPKESPKNYILGVGRLDKNKSFDLLIEAFVKLPFTDLHLIILGEGEEKKNLESIISNKGMCNRIHLHGLVDDIWPWYRYAKCLVSTSQSESWGNVIVEAMSQNCPVIAFDCNYGPREIITHDVNGLLVKLNDIQSLIVNITRLLSDNHLRKKIIYNGLIRSSEFENKILNIKWLKD